jgi:hypothetical protein
MLLGGFHLINSQSLKATELDPNVRPALACLLRQDWVKDDIHNIGLRLGEKASVRYAIGSIPDTSPETPGMLNITVYSKDQKRGWLFFVRPEKDGTLTAIRNAYALKRYRSGWSAGEGNGGLATYEAIGAYANQLAKSTDYRMTLNPGKDNCHVED